VSELSDLRKELGKWRVIKQQSCNGRDPQQWKKAKRQIKKYKIKIYQLGERMIKEQRG
jgi:hypothetical protein